MNPKVRVGTKDDVPQLLHLIQELAEYEKEPEAVIVTVEQLIEDGFGAHPLYEFFVAEENDEIVGIALYYYCYSTWKGRYLYLEDLIVKESHRRNGIGKILFEAIVAKAKAEKVKRLGWQVLDWNESAIEFYRKFDADISEEWLNGRLYFD